MVNESYVLSTCHSVRWAQMFCQFCEKHKSVRKLLRQEENFQLAPGSPAGGQKVCASRACAYGNCVFIHNGGA
jgi:hypothetical protein